MPRRCLRTFAAQLSDCRSLLGGRRRVRLGAQRTQDEKALIASEVKWKRLSPAERRKIETILEQRWQRCALRHRYSRLSFPC